MRLRTKLLAGSLLLAFSLWPVAWYAERTSREALERVLLERATRQAGEVLDAVLRVERDRLRELQVFVRQPAFRAHLVRSNAEFARLDDPDAFMDRVDAAWCATPADVSSPAMQDLLSNDCARALTSYVSAVDDQHGFPLFGEIFVTNRHGANVGQTGRTSDYRQDDEEWWQDAARDGVHIGGVEHDHSADLRSTTLCIRVDDEDGAMLGVLKAVLDIRVVTRILDDRADGTDARLLLVDRDGHVLHDTSGQEDELVDVSRFEDPIQVASGVSILHAAPSPDGSDHAEALAAAIGAGTRAPDWRVLVEVPTRGVLQPSRELGSRIRWAAGIVSVLGSAFGLFLSLTTARRVERLRSATGQIRDGVLDHRVEDRRRDELGHLAAGFNDMAAGLEAAQRDVEVARAAKDAFLTNMSHEIRTPLTAIVGAVEVLVDPELGEDEREEYFQTIRTSSQHLVSLINSILDLSKVEAGKLSVERVPCSPAHIAHEVIDLLSHQSAAKGLELELRFATGVPETIESDPTRIRQVLVNLVGNAIKFTDRGGVAIELAFVPGDDASLRFGVTDTGIGIDPRNLDKIFRPFEQADMSTTRLFGGTGLGLTISRELARVLGGDLTVQTGPTGSTFTLTVAAPGATAGRTIEGIQDLVPRAHEEAVAALDDVRGRRVLLAEDVPINRKLIATMLSRAGIGVTVATNGRTALERVRAAEAADRPFDLILMDLMMPELDGWAATRELRASGYTRPIVALTADAMRETAERCLDAGFDEVVTKPVRGSVLLDAVRRLAAAPEDGRRIA